VAALSLAHRAGASSRVPRPRPGRRASARHGPTDGRTDGRCQLARVALRRTPARQSILSVGAPPCRQTAAEYSATQSAQRAVYVRERVHAARVAFSTTARLVRPSVRPSVRWVSRNAHSVGAPRRWEPSLIWASVHLAPQLGWRILPSTPIPFDLPLPSPGSRLPEIQQDVWGSAVISGRGIWGGVLAEIEFDST